MTTARLSPYGVVYDTGILVKCPYCTFSREMPNIDAALELALVHEKACETA